MLSKYSVEPGYGFIVGTPWETKQEVISTIRLANRIRRLCPRARYAFSVLTPYPRSEIADELVSAGFLKEPRTLREWASDYARRSYTGFAGMHSAKPWNKNPGFLERLSYFSGLAYNTYSDSDIRAFLTHLNVKRYPDLFCIFLARLRMRFIFFGLPIDQILLGWWHAALRQLRGILRAPS
jgi:hypothetical protein